jgi:alcohol dehydrogenase (cytochrome c)
MPPLVHGGLIYIGPAGSETAAQGWVGAFRIRDGEQVWRFNIVPKDGEPGADTWGPDPAARKHGGGNLWTPMSFDLQRNLLYVPGGNAAPDLYDNDRPGDNLYTNSLIALDATTGHLAWYRQFIPHDVHDYDVSHVAPVFKTAINGSTRNVIASTGKDGLLRLLDRDSKDLIYSVPFTNRMNVEAPVTTTPVRVCPGTLGGQEWNGSAYYARQNLLIVPATDWCAEFSKDTTAPDPQKEHTHGFYFGGQTKFDPWSAARGRLTAFDASTGHETWRYDAAKPLVAGVTATAGDLIFTGELSGDLLALDARSGKLLLRSDLGGPAGGGVVTYSARGKQNVAIVSGIVGIYNLVAPEIGGGNTTVTVFRLPGN